MNISLTNRGLLRAVLLAFALFLAYRFLAGLTTILLLLAAALLLAVILSAPVEALHRRKLSRPVATGILVLGVAAVPPLLLAFVSGGSLDVLWVLLAYLAIQQIESNLLEPLVMEKAASLHPAAVLMSVTLLGTAFGILGTILAVPDGRGRGGTH